MESVQNGGHSTTWSGRERGIHGGDLWKLQNTWRQHKKKRFLPPPPPKTFCLHVTDSPLYLRGIFFCRSESRRTAGMTFCKLYVPPRLKSSLPWKLKSKWTASALEGYNFLRLSTLKSRFNGDNSMNESDRRKWLSLPPNEFNLAPWQGRQPLETIVSAWGRVTHRPLVVID
ncbi:hypothetical protein BaRGS_00031205 [Batillaria attramentaria]|uniref:Uncharacterized protein n=1 Tax=Batillaria attramentaria TaxID=370345 RepID=A0ABD0JSA0_9CAEN